MEIDALARVIENMQPRVPLNREFWSAREVGKYLKVSPRVVSERYAKRPDFPEPKRLPSDNGKGRLRWRAKDILAWAENL